MRSLAFVALFAACHATPLPPSPSPDRVLKYPALPCVADEMPAPIGVCGNKFTIVGKFACAICITQHGCVDTVDMVYCTTSCADSLCAVP